MKQNKIKYLEEETFRRLTGIKSEIFEKMLEILSDTDRKKKARSRRRNKLNLREKLLVTLKCILECRTYFHIGKNYDLNDSTTQQDGLKTRS